MTLKPLRLNLFLKELLLFSFTAIVGIFAAYRHFILQDTVLRPPSEFAVLDVVFALIFSTILFLTILKFRKVGIVFFNVFLVLLIFIGSHSVFAAFTSVFALP